MHEDKECIRDDGKFDDPYILKHKRKQSSYGSDQKRRNKADNQNECYSLEIQSYYAIVDILY